MPDISKITLPSGNTYDIKDAVARQAIAGGVAFVTAWNGKSAPMVAAGESFTTTLTPAEGKTLGTVTVKMGGADITSTAYSAGVVSIASVTGNIVITASAS